MCLLHLISYSGEVLLLLLILPTATPRRLVSAAICFHTTQHNTPFVLNDDDRRRRWRFAVCLFCFLFSLFSAYASSVSLFYFSSSSTTQLRIAHHYSNNSRLGRYAYGKTYAQYSALKCNKTAPHLTFFLLDSENFLLGKRGKLLMNRDCCDTK